MKNDDTFSLPTWPLGYTVGWIAYRDRARADLIADTLLSQGDADVLRAWSDLCGRLVAGELPATGLRSSAGGVSIRPIGGAALADERFDRRLSRKQIQPIEWVDLRPGPAIIELPSSVGVRARVRLPEQPNYVASERPGESYIDVRLLARDVLELWPVSLSGRDARVGQKRGAPRTISQRVEDEMLRDLAGGYDLAGAKQEELKAKYKTRSRNPVVTARKKVLSEINSRQFETKDN